MAKKGGKQPGAGRPKGAYSKPRLSDFLNEDKVNSLINKALELANGGNEVMLKFILEQHFGKASQSMDLTSGGETISICDKTKIDSALEKFIKGN